MMQFTSQQRGEKLGRHWTVGELWLNRSMPILLIDPKLVGLLDAFAEEYKEKPRFTSQNSIYCAGGHAANSYHYKGMAADFYIPGVEPVELAMFAEKIGAGGIGVYSAANRHIHADTRPVRTCWWILTTNSKTPGFGGAPVVFRFGDRSPAIARIQARLNADGCPCGSADGIFGAKTREALTAWQRQKGLAADGIFGRQTNADMELFSW